MSALTTSGAGKNSRPCPALNQFISPADCGAQRGSKLACPAACPFFPFGSEGYDLWLKVDGNWLGKALDFLVQRLGRAEVQARIRRFTVPMRSPQIALESAVSNVLNFSLFVERQPDGRTLAEVWGATSAARDLNNDERVMLRHRQFTRPGVAEVQEILDDLRLRCVDLLEPDRGEFILFDRGAAAQLVRFSRLLTWLTHYPHFSRANVFAMDLPHNIHAEWMDEIRARTAQAAAGRADYSVKAFLAEHFVDSVTLVQSLSDQYRQKLFASLDIRHCVASYRVKGDPAAIEAVLRAKPDFVPDEAPDDSQFAPTKAYYRWVQQGESAEFEQVNAARRGARVEASVGGVGTLANLRLYPERLLVETFSQSKHEFARQKLGQYLEALVEFEKESIVDLARIMEERRARDETVGGAEAVVFGETDRRFAAPDDDGDSPEAEKGDQIPSEVRQQAAAEAHRQHYERFLDESVPALGGATPRAAAADPALRPKLVELMKGHIHGVERRCEQDHLRLDLDWVLDALDLASLKKSTH